MALNAFRGRYIIKGFSTTFSTHTQYSALSTQQSQHSVGLRHVMRDVLKRESLQWHVDRVGRSERSEAERTSMLQAMDHHLSLLQSQAPSSAQPDPPDSQPTQLRHEFQRPGTPDNDLPDGEQLFSLSKNLWENHGL